MSDPFKEIVHGIRSLSKRVKKLETRAFSGTSGGSSDPDAIHENAAGEIAGIIEKTSIVNGDIFLIEDSADLNNKKKMLFSTIRTFLETLFAPITHVGSGGTAHADATIIADGFMTAADKVKLDGLGSGGGHVLEEEGVDLTTRDTLNFVGAGITASDDATNLKTKAWVDFNIHSTSIPVGETVTIPANTASIVAGAILVEGSLILEGVMVVL